VTAACTIVEEVEYVEYDVRVHEHPGAANGVANGPHYGAERVEYDVASALIIYEEYHPFGTSAYRAVDSTIQVTAKRYRYAAAERDEETGLDHMGLRYYAPWLGRWTSADPIGLGDGVNRYAYVHANPVSMRDPRGTNAQEPFQVGETITRERAEDFMRDASVGAEGTFPVRLTGGERYHVLRESSVEVLPGVSSGTEGHIAWQFKEGSTAKFSLQRAEALEANRIAYERSAQSGADRIIQAGAAIEEMTLAATAAVGGTLVAAGLAGAGVAGLLAEGAGGGVGGIIEGVGSGIREGADADEVVERAVVGGAGGTVAALGFGLLARGAGAIVGKLRGGAPIQTAGPAAKEAAPEPRTLYHYTDAPQESFKRGLWSHSSVTDDAALTAREAVEQLGVKRAPDKIIPVRDRGHFVPNKPHIVEPHPLGPGGGRDFMNPRKVPPEDILPARPVWRRRR
jgi:RHS repeat-associated protein